MQVTLSWDRAADLLGYPIDRAENVAGGDLSAVMCLHHASGTVIAKRGPLALAEAEMLEAIRRTGAPAPEVLAVTDDLLLLEDMPSGGKITRAWSSLADSLDHLRQPRLAAQYYQQALDAAGSARSISFDRQQAIKRLSELQ